MKDGSSLTVRFVDGDGVGDDCSSNNGSSNEQSNNREEPHFEPGEELKASRTCG